MQTEAIAYVKQIRKRALLNQREMAEKLGISYSLYGKVESGNKPITSKFIRALKAFKPDLDLDKFF